MELSTAPLGERIRASLGTRKGKFIALGSVAFVALIVATGVTYGRYARERQASGDGGPATSLPFSFAEREAPKEEKTPALLDGTLVDSDHAKRRPLAVMVENHPEARPQSGLDKTSVVVEAIAEGGITRFLAIFGPQDAGKIGPIRSARPYYVEYASGWKALYAHAGGSQGGLALIPKAPVVDLPHNGAFYREPRPGIASEHTLFSASDKLYEYASQKNASLTADFQAWQFEDDPDTANRPVSQSATVDFSSPTYKVGWNYDAASDLYRRTLAGSPHKDAVSGEQLTAETVAIITVTRHTNPNSNQGKGEVTMDTSGSGKAVVLKHGHAVTGTWKKESIGGMLRFLDDQGNELKLGRGRTWIEVIHGDVPVTIE